MVSEWDLLWRLALALALAGAIGLERELNQKSAGLRTYTVVGVGAALFMLISQYGFFGVLKANTVILDPSRVAAQIVSGIGFIGAGLIFVRRDAVVKGLTTAAGIWLTAAIGAAAAADLPVLAVAATVGYFVIVYAISPIAALLPGSPQGASRITITYEDGRGVLRRVLAACTGREFKVGDVEVDRLSSESGSEHESVEVALQLHGRGSVADLAAELEDLDGVLAVTTHRDSEQEPE
jgi:putative Mg2+ transporter-C (MgtC) family protein